MELSSNVRHAYGGWKPSGSSKDGRMRAKESNQEKQCFESCRFHQVEFTEVELRLPASRPAREQARKKGTAIWTCRLASSRVAQRVNLTCVE